MEQLGGVDSQHIGQRYQKVKEELVQTARLAAADSSCRWHYTERREYTIINIIEENDSQARTDLLKQAKANSEQEESYENNEPAGGIGPSA